jgi:preprotein translocase SecE subunit
MEQHEVGELQTSTTHAGKTVGGLQHQINRIKTFFSEMVEELKKCSWPNRQELVQQTGLVIVVSLAVSAFGGMVAYVCVGLLKAMHIIQ